MGQALSQFTVKYDAESRTWEGYPKLNPLLNPHASMGRHLYHALVECPQHVAIKCWDDHSDLSNADILEYASRAALSYRNDYRLKRGDFIAFVAKNSKYLTPAVIGAIFNLNPVYGVDFLMTAHELEGMFITCVPSLVVCDAESVEKVEQALKARGLETPVAVMKNTDLPDFMTEPLRKDEYFYPLETEDGNKEVMALICSSGTTGIPKAIRISHGSAVVMMNMPKQGPRRLLCFSSMGWSSGLIWTFGGVLQGVTRVTTSQMFSCDLARAMIERYDINEYFASTYHYRLVLDDAIRCGKQYPSLTMTFTMGSKTPDDIYDSFKFVFPNAFILTGYGCSEKGGVTLKQSKMGYDCQGQIGPGVSIRIVDQNGSRLKAGQVGEMHVKTAVPNLGYHNNEAATREVFLDDGWFATGDIGYVTEQGLLYVLDRKKEMIRTNGGNVYPTEMETLIRSLPGVKFVCVVPLTHPVHDQIPAAVVVREEGSLVSGQAIVDLIAERLNNYKQLRGGVYFMSQLPMTSTSQKFKKREIIPILQDLYLRKQYDAIYEQ